MIPFFGKQKLLLAFEYGVTLAEVAKKNKIKLSLNLMKKAEDILLQEFASKKADALGKDMGFVLLSMLEPKDEK